MATLSGKRVIVTRSVAQGAELREELEALGAEVMAVPTIRFAVAQDPRPWREALERRPSFTHVAFTSQVAVRFFLELSRIAHLSLDDWRHSRFVAIGEATAKALRDGGRGPDLVGVAGNAVEFAGEMVEKEDLGPGKRVLLPQSELARHELEVLLRAAGAGVDAVAIYQTLPESPERAEPFRRAIEAGETFDAITFASPSAFRFFLEITAAAGRCALASTRLVAIGPTTRRAVEAAGFTVAAEAASPDTPGLIAAVVQAIAE